MEDEVLLQKIHSVTMKSLNGMFLCNIFNDVFRDKPTPGAGEGVVPLGGLLRTRAPRPTSLP